MRTKNNFQPGTPVRVKGCRGIARIDHQIRGYGVYLLDRPIDVCYRGSGGVSFDKVVRFWTFPRKELEIIKLG